MEFPKTIYIQIDDIDDGKAYYQVAEKREDLQFSESERHPIREYQLVELPS